MKGFKAKLSVTISRKQMIEIYQKYYDENRKSAISNQKNYDEYVKMDDTIEGYYPKPSIPDCIKFNNVLGYEYGNDKYLHFENVISGKWVNETVRHFCRLLDDEFAGWNYHDGANYNFQSCALCSYMYYEAIRVDNISVSINGNDFMINGNVYDIDTEELLFNFKATPGINSYDIDYYMNGKKMDCLEFANLEASKICGAGNADVDNAIYYVISNAIHDAMVETLPISILIRACLDADNAHEKDLRIPNARDYIKHLFAEGVIDRFITEFMMAMIDKDGNICC